MVLALSTVNVIIPEWKGGQYGMLHHYVVLERALDVGFNFEVDAYRAKMFGWKE